MGPLAAAYGLGRAAFGAIQGNQTRQRNKGLISQAYRTGRERLDLTQGDVRQNVQESAVARGLAGGGGVRASGPVHPTGGGGVGSAGYKTKTSYAMRVPGHPQFGVTPTVTQVGGERAAPPVSVSGAYDLGSQQGSDLAREQQLEQTDLVRQKDAALAGNDAEYANTLVGSAAAGVAGAGDVANAYGAMKAPGVTDAFGAGRLPEGTTAPDTPYKNAFMGIDPVNPLERGAWARNADFNVYGRG